MKSTAGGVVGLLVVFVVCSGVLADQADYQTATSTDDTYCSSSSNYVTNSTMNWPPPSTRRTFMRWELDIPAGATITSAYVKVKASATDTGTPVVRLQLVDSDDCPAFSSNPYAWSVTGSTVDWTVPDYTQDTWYTSPDVKTIVQGFVDRGGYAPGNFLGLRGVLVSGSAKIVYQWDYSSHTNGAILEVNYTTNESPVADAGIDQTDTDQDDTGYETVTLDGSASGDSDGTVVSWVWSEGGSQIATGEMASVSLAVGTHTITLVVTDDDEATDDDDVVIMVNPEAPTETEYQTAASTDDTYCSSSSNYAANSTMNWPPPSTRRAFMRWELDVPAGATITSAYVKVKASSTAAGTSVVQLQLVDSDNCPAFSSNSYAWAVTGPTVDWTVPDYTQDTWYTSPDVKTIVQGFVDRGGYAPGNFLGLRGVLVSGSAKNIYQWDYSGHTSGATLQVTYTGVNHPPVADAGEDQTVSDFDSGGSETVALDGSGSSDCDGTIMSYTWKEGASQIATGETAQASLAVGTHTITLEVTDNDGATDSDDVLITIRPTRYYVDFDGGSDTNDGTSTATAWKHCPGDDNATDVPASFTLLPGDEVTFKGGVRYRGEIEVNWSGTSENPIVYDGNTAETWGTGKAIIDGSELLTGWTQCTSANDCDGNPNWANIYYTYAPAVVQPGTANIFEDDNMCWLAQEPDQPDPFFMDIWQNFYVAPTANCTQTSISDSTVLDQADSSYWDKAFVLVHAGWNQIYYRRILSFTPATDTITFDAVGTLYETNTEFSPYNSLHLLDMAGEYVVDPDPEGDGTHKVWLWPLVSSDIGTKNFRVSVRQIGFHLSKKSYITIQGFEISKFSGSQDFDGHGILALGEAGTRGTGLTVRDNDLKDIRHDLYRGNGFIRTFYYDDCLIDGNTLAGGANQSGICCASGENVIVQDSVIEKIGNTGIWFQQIIGGAILDNVVNNGLGTHANGISVYYFSEDIAVMGNHVFNSNVCLTTDEVQNILIAYNVLDGNNLAYTYASWGDDDYIEVYNNTMVNAQANVGITITNEAGDHFTVKNNILAGFTSKPAWDVTNNLYLGKVWNQGDLRTGEILEEDPDEVFVDYDNRNYHLVEGSPAIDAGVDVDLDYDIEGTSVPQGDDPDIGAYEHESP